MTAFANRTLFVVDYDVPAVMRDGTVLRANIFRPGEPGRWPTVLVRTPYDKNVAQPDLDAAGVGPTSVPVDRAGHSRAICIGGYLGAVSLEAQDGYDSVEWAAKLPHSNGLAGHVRRKLLRQRAMARCKATTPVSSRDRTDFHLA